MSEDDRHQDRIHIGDLGPGDVALLKNIAVEAAEQTVRRFSTAIGLDPDDPFEAQQDLQWVRKTRKRAEGIHGKAIMTAIVISVGGAAEALWSGIKAVMMLPGAH
jgi:hypothetical protein